MKQSPTRNTQSAARGARERRWRFEHHGLAAYDVALDAYVLGDAMARELPRGYGALKDQLRRALGSSFLQTSEAAGRAGADRQQRMRVARAEAGEAAAALEACERLGLVDPARVDVVMERLWRLCAMLHGLSRKAR